MLKMDDFIINKHGLKKFHCFCDSCGTDRGYLAKTRRGNTPTGPNCVRCANGGSDILTSDGFCKFCDVKHELPAIGESNLNWLWETHKKGSINGGFWRCKDYLADKANKWDINNPDKLKIKRTKGSLKYKSTLRGKIRSNISSRMASLLAKKKVDINYLSKSKFDGLNWTVEDLIKHLESKFKIGMTWDNYGIDGWEVDHVTPDSWFNYQSINDQGFKDSWMLSNLQPTWANLNRSKSDRFAGGY
jgi:hypothetical protein